MFKPVWSPAECPAGDLDSDEATAAVAWIPGSPLIAPADLPRPLRWEPPDAAWQASIDAGKWWASGYHGTDAVPPGMTGLRERLLAFGGAEACLPVADDDLAAILGRGQLWYGDGAEMVQGRPSGCHENSALLWDSNRDTLLLATGYALSFEGGMWRQHSWCVRPTPSGGRVVETTEHREAYFGFVMDEAEAEAFLESNT